MSTDADVCYLVNVIAIERFVIYQINGQLGAIGSSFRCLIPLRWDCGCLVAFRKIIAEFRITITYAIQQNQICDKYCKLNHKTQVDLSHLKRKSAKHQSTYKKITRCTCLSIIHPKVNRWKKWEEKKPFSLFYISLSLRRRRNRVRRPLKMWLFCCWSWKVEWHGDFDLIS